MIRIGVFKAAGAVERRVSLEAAVGLEHERVLERVVAAAVVVGAQLRGEGVH